MRQFYHSLLTFNDFYSTNGLNKIDTLFQEYLKDTSFPLLKVLVNYREKACYDSETILHLAPLLENFISKIFTLEERKKSWKNNHEELFNIFYCRRKFVQRNITYSDYNETALLKAQELFRKENILLTDELALAKLIIKYQKDENISEYLKSFIAWALFSASGRKQFKDSVLFSPPQKLDYDNLVVDAKRNDISVTVNEHKSRNGFDLDENYLSQKSAVINAHYCLDCHKRGKDSCSKGMLDKVTNMVIKNPLDIILSGCPLRQKISEMNILKKQGIIIGALATAMIDNPMIAATGHRICNDCMKSCVYQKQDPVNVPLIESKVFDEVLRLPYGFEIYNLLSRWNPLKCIDFLPAASNNKNILIVGMGPAGITLAHYLSNSGCTVVGIDGLKIEPLPSNIVGIDQHGNRSSFNPIEKFSGIEEKLSSRLAYGFGGVTEYGITTRWNKNYLTVLRILLERRENFRLYGSTRFGSTITYERAQTLGFHHVALAMGAGKPQFPSLQNIFAKGIKTASDFLMSLHTQKVSRLDMPSNLQIRLPIVVLGGGLTSVDVSTECLAYYPILVKKFLQLFERAGDGFLQSLSEEEREIAHEYITHAQILKRNTKNPLKLLKTWGGVKIIYRKGMVFSPAYRLNHEELISGLQEGVEFLENTKILKILLDRHGSTNAVVTNNGIIKAATIIIATGTVPNITICKEDPKNFQRKGQYFATEGAKLSKNDFFIHNRTNFSISVHGDQHQFYSGSVVKAIASAKNSHSQITQRLLGYRAGTNKKDLFKRLNNDLIASVHAIQRLSHNVVEIIVKAKMSAEEFQPGQFYRLQNYSTLAHLNSNKIMQAMEPLAITGAYVDKIAGTISLIILEMGGSSNFCKNLVVGEIISLMGPTGSPTVIPKNNKVLLVGGGLGNAVLFSIAQALQRNNCNVLYFAAYKKRADIFKSDMIEKFANKVVWCCEDGKKSCREQDASFDGNIIAALRQYGDLKSFEHVIAIGSDSMMHAVARLIYHDQPLLFHPKIKAVASINSPMQCMMKEICAQCLQRQVDPETKEVSFIYSCFEQDQDMACVDFAHLAARLKQNSLLEKLLSTQI